MSTETEANTNNNTTASKVTVAVAYIALAAGLALGIYGLFAALGVWFGMWTFREGFTMLRNVNTYADWLAWAAVAATLFVFIAGRKLAMKNTLGLTSFAAVGAVAAALAFFVPESYRAAEGTPAIHDIATDTDNPLPYVAIAPLRADAPNTMDYGVAGQMTRQEHAAAQLKAYPDIVPQEYTDSKAVVFERALMAVDKLGWELVAQDLDEGRIEATDTTFWFRFKDDVVIKIEESANGTTLNARSLSRVGGSDIGKNAERLRAFFALM